MNWEEDTSFPVNKANESSATRLILTDMFFKAAPSVK